MSKKIKIELTEKEFELLRSALFEYINICDGEADISHDGDGTVFKQTKTAGLKISRQLERLSFKMFKQSKGIK